MKSTKTGQWQSVSSEHKAYVDFPGNNVYTMEKLSADTHYRVELRAHNKIGLGAPASIIVRTAPGQGEWGSRGHGEVAGVTEGDLPREECWRAGGVLQERRGRVAAQRPLVM